MMKVGVIIVCAGQGRRLGQPKANFFLANKPLFCHSLEVFLKINSIKQVVLVLQKKHFKIAAKFVKDEKVIFAQGAELRGHSVAKGLAKIKDDIGCVLIHDCARPFITKKMVMVIIENLKKHSAVIPGLKITDTLKKVKGQKIVKTVKRDGLFSIQTPQGFKKSLLDKVYKGKQKIKATDSAQLFEDMGEEVKVVKGGRFNFKVTYPEDIYWARKLWKITEPD